MFKILGEECIYIDIAHVFGKQIVALSAFDEKAAEFGKLFEDADTSFMLNGATEESVFIIKVPDEYTPEQIQLMADVVIRSINRFGQAPVTVNDQEQKYRIIISNDHEPEIIGLNKTPGMSSIEVFKPIIGSWSGEGKHNDHQGNVY